MGAAFVLLLARLAPRRERQSLEPLLGDVAVAVHAGTVGAFVDPGQCLVNATERLHLLLKDREVEVRLAPGLRGFAKVTHAARSAGTSVTHATLNILLNLVPAIFQELPKLYPSRIGHVPQSPES